MDARAMVLGPDNLRVKLEGYRDAEFIASARSLVPELIAEVERLRSYKSLPLDMVWQDYYSPNDVLKIRQPLDAEIEQLRAEVERLRAALADLTDPDDCWYDRNGNCQAHGFFNGECGHAVAKRLLQPENGAGDE
ncbi:hypothetical protein [Mycolicibacterium phage Kashi_SSH1]|nr:hypothetical protein [Mycolicibacterium phage Kashi_SSH1]